jgi:hypothetical protein
MQRYPFIQRPGYLTQFHTASALNPIEHFPYKPSGYLGQATGKFPRKVLHLSLYLLGYLCYIHGGLLLEIRDFYKKIFAPLS